MFYSLDTFSQIDKSNGLEAFCTVASQFGGIFQMSCCVNFTSFNHSDQYNQCDQ